MGPREQMRRGTPAVQALCSLPTPMGGRGQADGWAFPLSINTGDGWVSELKQFFWKI